MGNYVSVFESEKARARWKFMYLILDRQGNWVDRTLHTRLKQIGLGSIALAIALFVCRRFNRNTKSATRFNGERPGSTSAPNR